MRFGIVTFPGSNCDYDAFHVITETLGEEGMYLWHKDHDLRGADVVILPGGFSYADANGTISADANPNGSERNIAGIISEGGNVLGLMPHPERACSPLLGSSDGVRLFESILSRVAA